MAPLAGSLKESHNNVEEQHELEVTDSWQEALRLLVVDCRDDDVDEVLMAIANPLPKEDKKRTLRPRTILAARCLVDEPNVSDSTAEKLFLASPNKLLKEMMLNEEVVCSALPKKSHRAAGPKY